MRPHQRQALTAVPSGLEEGDRGKPIMARARQTKPEEVRNMQKVLHQKATVLPGGKLEIVSDDLEAGQTVDVVVLHESSDKPSRSIIEILNSGPEQRLFQTAEEVRAYLADEKASWDR